eukprot:m.227854 g.227854  ORF g.227854 m.227854 type:complete len:109 (-) comp13873_c0_seq2:78-404(-)
MGLLQNGGRRICRECSPVNKDAHHYSLSHHQKATALLLTRSVVASLCDCVVDYAVNNCCWNRLNTTLCVCGNTDANVSTARVFSQLLSANSFSLSSADGEDVESIPHA